jgi:hypothetical protein
MDIFESENRRLDGINVVLPDIIINNGMTDRERDYFIIGQKLEFKILSEEWEKLIELRRKIGELEDVHPGVYSDLKKVLDL